MLKVLYMNIMGLDIGKLNYLVNLIEFAAQETIIIIAEHWFSNFQKLKESKYFLCSSSLHQKKEIGHQNGGIAILTSRTIASQIKDITSLEYSITFSIRRERIRAVYLPPRLLDRDILNIISHEIEKVTILMGDINVRFGKLLQDKRSWNSQRGQAIVGYLPCGRHFFRK
jgi:hypothetical protein